MKIVNFKHTNTMSKLRNGLVKTLGLNLQEHTMPVPGSEGETQRVLHISAINGRHKNATGYIELPMDTDVLRETARVLMDLAETLAVPNIEMQTEAMQAVIDNEIREQSMAHEDMIDLLDEWVHDTHGNETASIINNQGMGPQIKALILAGVRTKLMQRLEIEGIHPLSKLSDIYDQMIFELSGQGAVA